MLEFHEANLSGIGRHSSSPVQQWANLELRLRNSETGIVFGVETDILVPKHPETTMLDIQESARTAAIEMLEAALQLLRESSIAELEDEVRRREQEDLD